jgi:hypothetical protein
MTATVYEITAYLPHPLRRTPPEYQPMVTPLDPVDRAALDFWCACKDVRSERRTLGSVLFGRRAGAEGTLCRLRFRAALPSIKDRAERTLIEEGCIRDPRGVMFPFGNPWMA